MFFLGECGSSKKKKRRKEGCIMKKVFVVLAVLALVAPAFAAVTITCSAVGKEVTVGFTNPTGKVRAFGLEITVDHNAVITDVNELDVGYWVHPGSVYILGNVVQDEGSAVASGDKTSKLIVEMGSLYAANDPLHPTPPDQAQDLLKFKVSSNDCTVTVTENAIRGGLVMEDGSTPGITGGTCVINLYPGTCWSDWQCLGQSKGDASCNGQIDFLDFVKMKQSLFKSKGNPLYNCCADFDRSNQVNFIDFVILKQNLFTSGYFGSKVQSCPP
jgi:hypothetical protein